MHSAAGSWVRLAIVSEAHVCFQGRYSLDVCYCTHFVLTTQVVTLIAEDGVCFQVATHPSQVPVFLPGPGAPDERFI